MARAFLASRWFAAGLIAIGCAPVALVVAQSPATRTGAADARAVQRTPWGHPDLQGIWSAGYLLTPVERPDKFAGREFLTDEEAAALEKEQATSPGRNKRSDRGSVSDVEGAYNDVFTGRGTSVVRTKRTSLVVDPPDGRIPFTPEGRKRRPVRVVDPEAGPGGIANHPEDRVRDRCTGITLPVDYGSAATSGGYIRLVQSPSAVTIYYEHGHHGGVYRTIPLDGSSHLPPQVRQWLGDSRGRWEGDTLVVETKNFTNGTNYQGSKDNLHLVERFTSAGQAEFIYRVTITDPTTYTRPWTLEIPYTRADERKNAIFEAACHEGNYALTSILAGARAAEKEAVAAKAKPAKRTP